MIDVVVGGTRSLFVDLLLSVLHSRGFETTLAAPTSDALSLSVAMSRPSLCVVHHGIGDGAPPLALVEAAVSAGRGATRVVVLSATANGEAVTSARDAGAAGYVHTSTGMDAMLLALTRVREGQDVVCLPRPVDRPRRPDSREVVRLAASLTRRERECLGLLVDGVGTTAIAEQLTISELTVRSHVQGILSKLGVHSRLEAASLTVRHGLLDVVERNAVRVG